MVKKNLWVRGARMKGKMNKQSKEDFQGNKTTLYDTIMVKTSHYIFVKTQRVKKEKNNYVQHE